MKLLTELDSLDNVKDGETRILPTKVSQLQNDSGYITSSSLPTKTSDLTNNSGFITNAVDNLSNYTKTSDLHAVATSGSYNDLSNKPTIPTDTNDLTNGAEYITFNDIPTNISYFANDELYVKEQDITNVTGDLSDLETTAQTDLVSAVNEVNSNIPTNTSDLTNDSNFAVTNANNNFSSSQSITGDLTVSGTAQIQNGLYCRPTGQADTPVGNSMLVIKRVTNSEAPNNGVVLEFGNSTSWTGQLYIGDNATQGIYYNGWSNGVRGSWIRLASQNDVAKDIITMELTGSQSFGNAYAKLNLSARTTIGTKLSVSSNQVKIGSGVNHIKVSATFGYNYASAGMRYLRITKNYNANNLDGTTIALQQKYENNTNHVGTLAITDIVIPVNEGDLIGMYVYGLNGDSVRYVTSGMIQTNMTIEVID